MMKLGRVGRSGGASETEKGCLEQWWTAGWLERLGQSRGAQVKMASIGAGGKSWGTPGSLETWFWVWFCHMAVAGSLNLSVS